MNFKKVLPKIIIWFIVFSLYFGGGNAFIVTTTNQMASLQLENSDTSYLVWRGFLSMKNWIDFTIIGVCILTFLNNILYLFNARNHTNKK